MCRRSRFGKSIPRPAKSDSTSPFNPSARSRYTRFGEEAGCKYVKIAAGYTPSFRFGKKVYRLGRDPQRWV